MNKKIFFGGVAAGVVVSVASVFVFNFATVITNASNGEIGSVYSKSNFIVNMLETYYVDEVDDTILAEGMYKGIVDSLGDPYTTYLTAEEYNSFTETTSGSFEGVGINVIADEEKGILTVISPIEGSPAAAAGIMPGDIIIKVNGEDVVGLDSNEVISRIKGEEGTEVTITMERSSKSIDFTVKRAKVDVPSISSKMLENKIGYIEISGFKTTTYEQFSVAYKNLVSQGMKGLILDVRDNPGGMLDVVTEIADAIIPEGVIVYTVDKQGNREDFTSEASSISVPLVMLVNGNSASASEVLAGAVRDSGTGVLVGTQTFGKGLVQSVYPLTDGSALKITVQKYYTPNGTSIQGVGLEPDYIVELPEGQYKSLITDESQDTQLQKALEVIGEKIK